MPAVGRNENAIRSYIRQQEKKDAWLDQLNLWCRPHLQVAPKSGPRQRPRTAASSGSPRNAPGFAGGYLLLCAPRLHPGAGALLQLLEDAPGDERVDVAALWGGFRHCFLLRFSPSCTCNQDA